MTGKGAKRCLGAGVCLSLQAGAVDGAGQLRAAGQVGDGEKNKNEP